MDRQDGIRPDTPNEAYHHFGQGEVGAVEGQVGDADFGDLVADGAFEEVAEGMQEEVGESREVEGPEGDGGEEGQDPKERRAPMKPARKKLPSTISHKTPGGCGARYVLGRTCKRIRTGNRRSTIKGTGSQKSS